MENIFERGPRASIYSERRTSMVPPCPDCCSGDLQVISGSFKDSLPCGIQPIVPHQIRLYSRDMELSNQNVLHREVLMSPVIILSLVDNSLLVYTADNMLSHYLIIPTANTIKLHLCGSITFDGIITLPSAMRVLSWMIPNAQKRTFMGFQSTLYLSLVYRTR
jgi:hypothetical protein